MPKKNRKPQIRKRQKPTTGRVEFTDVVYLEREKDENGKEQVFAVCTCNKWRSSPEATTITKVGLEAKKHVDESDGKCRLRNHSVPVTGIAEMELTEEQLEKAREMAAQLDAEAAEAEETE